MLRLIRWSATLLVVLVAGAWGIVWVARDDSDSRAAALLQAVARRMDGDAAPNLPVTDRAAIGGPFSLVEASGRPVTDQTYRGRWMLVYFGYTYCPDITPTMLQTISTVLDDLGDKAAQIAPLFITVDPKRDTPAAIGQYVALFDQRLIGLTGTAVQIAGAESAYRVFSQRVGVGENGTYMVDYRSDVYLMAPDGKLKALFKDGTAEADMVESIVAAMSGRR